MNNLNCRKEMLEEYDELKRIAFKFNVDSHIYFFEYDNFFGDSKINIYVLESLLYELTLKIRRCWAEKKVI